MGGHAAWRKRVARGELAKGLGGAIMRHRPHRGRKGKDLILNRKGHIGGGNPKKKQQQQQPKGRKKQNGDNDDDDEEEESSTAKTVKQRLQALDEIMDVLSKEEYNRKRQEILHAI